MNEKGNIKLEVATEAQRDYFNMKVRPGLTRYFQENIANIEYIYDINIAEKSITPKRAYTDEDRLNVLMRKNPDLEIMREIFKLDFDS